MESKVIELAAELIKVTFTWRFNHLEKDDEGKGKWEHGTNVQCKVIEYLTVIISEIAQHERMQPDQEQDTFFLMEQVKDINNLITASLMIVSGYRYLYRCVCPEDLREFQHKVDKLTEEISRIND